MDAAAIAGVVEIVDVRNNYFYALTFLHLYLVI